MAVPVDNLKRRKSLYARVLQSKLGQNPPNCPRTGKAEPTAGQKT